MQFTAVVPQMTAAGLCQPVAVQHAVQLAKQVSQGSGQLQGFNLDKELVRQLQSGENKDLSNACFLDGIQRVCAQACLSCAAAMQR